MRWTSDVPDPLITPYTHSDADARRIRERWESLNVGPREPARVVEPLWQKVAWWLVLGAIGVGMWCYAWLRDAWPSILYLVAIVVAYFFVGWLETRGLQW